MTAASRFAVIIRRSSIAAVFRAVFQSFCGRQADTFTGFPRDERDNGLHANPDLMRLAAKAGVEGNAVVVDGKVGGRRRRDVQYQHFFLQEVQRHAVYPTGTGRGDNKMRCAVVIHNPLVDGAQQIGLTVGHGDFVAHQAPGRNAASCLESDLRK